jgi:hypothetical protein
MCEGAQLERLPNPGQHLRRGDRGEGDKERCDLVVDHGGRLTRRSPFRLEPLAISVRQLRPAYISLAGRG